MLITSFSKKYFLKKILLTFLFAGSFALGTLGAYLYLGLSQIFIKSTGQVTTEIPSNSNQDSTNILLLGYGGIGHDGGNLADVVMILNFNPKSKEINLISIPRDLWVEIPVRSDISEKHKINFVHAIGLDDKKYPLKEPQYKGDGGGGTMAKKVVSEVSGMQIDYFIAIDFEGFKKIIDTLGGVDVDVPVTFDDYFYPIKGKENETCGKPSSEIAKLHKLYKDTELHHQFECRYEHIHFDKGLAHTDGETALKFVRSRASSQHGGDFARSQRQHAVLLGVKDKLISLSSVKKIDELFVQFTKMVKTDLDLNTIRELSKIVGKPQDYKISFISLNEDNVLVSTKSLDGQFILIPKEGEDVWLGVQKFIYENIN